MNTQLTPPIERADFDDFDLPEAALDTFDEAVAVYALPDSDAPPEENEPVKRLHGRKENPKREPAAFARHREAVRAASKVKLVDFIRALARGGTIREAAEAAGVSYSWARQYLWPEAKRIALTEWTAPEEKERLGNLIVESLEAVLRRALERLPDHAAYGAVAISAAKEIRDTLGIDFRGTGGSDSAVVDLEVLGEQIREAMPALLSHQEHIARIKQRQLEAKALQAAQDAMPD